MDCGPSCLRMIAKYYGKAVSLQYLRQKCQIQKQGVSLLGISDAAELMGFKTLAAKIDYSILSKDVVLPAIVHWNQNHFVVVFDISSKSVSIADPARGIIKIKKDDFIRKWISNIENGEEIGIVLILDPTSAFNTDEESNKQKGLGFRTVLSHFKRFKSLFFQLGVGMLIGLLLQLFLPFLTQSVVDVGIASKDMGFITLVLIAQVMIFVGSAVVEFIRSWIMLHISTRINISLLTEFFIKLMKLPMSYFDAKMTGDITQRMGDHNRIQSFFTGTLLNTAFSLINFVVFTFMAIAYSMELFLVSLIGSVLYFGWMLIFLPARKRLDFNRFDLSAINQNITIEMIQGMQEIKLNNCEKQKRWNWERTQAKIFKLSIRSLFTNQMQSTGALFINQGKNVLLTFLSAREVVNGNLTLGGMMAVQFIILQLNSPIQQIIQFIQSWQDARISLERINEIQQMEDEDASDKLLSDVLPPNKGIEFKNLSYKYPGNDNEYVLKNIDLYIPEGKTTAIVGMSGSGKTTLLKILLRFYEITEGEIRVGSSKLASINCSIWRSRCGVVMQEGYIFSDTIAANIAVGDDYPDPQKLLHAITVANIQDFIESLPLGFNTQIGAQGSGISQGQKQRILIARAVYKDPDYILLDEATNALDANNELTIMNNLQSFFKGKTVVIVAHRLSTVKKADHIVVLDNGYITETGTHEELSALKKDYYRLVKNQLELGN